mmetsp:Transcript_49904/g.56472  ORF Transcript_49904/g.56472 Transcript_49904/m.56472 type:complete len:129 (-) Transcript_49904:488-874(-)
MERQFNTRQSRFSCRPRHDITSVTGLDRRKECTGRDNIVVRERTSRCSTNSIPTFDAMRCLRKNNVRSDKVMYVVSLVGHVVCVEQTRIWDKQEFEQERVGRAMRRSKSRFQKQHKMGIEERKRGSSK